MIIEKSMHTLPTQNNEQPATNVYVLWYPVLHYIAENPNMWGFTHLVDAILN